MIPENTNNKKDLIKYLLDIGFKQNTRISNLYTFKDATIEFNDTDEFFEFCSDAFIYDAFYYHKGIPALNKYYKFEFRKKIIAKLLDL